jgi:hypothetical protein
MHRDGHVTEATTSTSAIILTRCFSFYNLRKQGEADGTATVLPFKRTNQNEDRKTHKV